MVKGAISDRTDTTDMTDMTDRTDRTETPWKARVLTLFPEMFPGPLGASLAGRALAEGLWELDVINIRNHAPGRHRAVDAPPFGGGPGMVMRPDVVLAALNEAADGLPPSVPRIYFTPRGRRLDQQMIRDMAATEAVVMLCGRYEGIDERVIDHGGLMEVSIGDVVLSGGELPALMAIDAVVRLLPGVMGNPEAPTHDSFENGLLEYPLYTQPRLWQGMPVPDVLLSGNHGAIRQWREEASQALTRTRRPDLWQAWLNAQKQKKT